MWSGSWHNVEQMASYAIPVECLFLLNPMPSDGKHHCRIIPHVFLILLMTGRISIDLYLAF